MEDILQSVIIEYINCRLLNWDTVSQPVNYLVKPKSLKPYTINRLLLKCYNRNKQPKRPFSLGKLTNFTRKLANFGTF